MRIPRIAHIQLGRKVTEGGLRRKKKFLQDISNIPPSNHSSDASWEDRALSRFKVITLLKKRLGHSSK